MATNTTSGLPMEFQQMTFSWVDYSLFGGLLGLSLLIGVYFGFFSKQDNVTEYLFGGKKMGYIPVATSMVAGHISGITLLGVPTEVYQHGADYMLNFIAILVSTVVIIILFLPIFFDLQLPSTYEYLELRFSRSVRSLSSALYITSLLMYIPVVIYVPALAFSYVSGFSMHMITPILCTICIIYTSIGGVKAVIWADTLQYMFTMGSLLSVFFLGLQSVGGISETWRIASAGKRTAINMDPSPFARNTFWGMSIGFTVSWISHFGVSQGYVQRCLSIPKLHDIKKAMWLVTFGFIFMSTICAFTGIILYAKYYDCDPLRAQIIERSDQALPYYVMDVAGHISGLPGLFLAGLVSSALSTMSAGLNTISGAIYDDFIDQWVEESPTKQAKAANIMKVIVVIIGFLSIGMVFIVEHLGTIFEMAMSIRSVVEGPLLGLFILGMCLPWAGKKGALTGGIAAIFVLAYIVGGTQWHVYNKRIRHPPLPTSTDNCPYPLNGSLPEVTTLPPLTPEEEPMLLFHISMMYYSTIGTFVVVAVGLTVSYFAGEIDIASVKHELITPVMRRFLPPKKYEEVAISEMPEPDKSILAEKQ